MPIQLSVPSLKGTRMSILNETRKPLLPQHRKLIEDSGIDERIISVRGYYSEEVKSDLAKLGFSYAQRMVPALVVPIWGLDGQVLVHQIRPDQPRSSRGKFVKYETPSGAKLAIDVPPSVREKVLLVKEPLFITEGIRKADAAASFGLACLGLMGVYGWKQQEDFWKSIPLDQRDVYIVFDSDISTNVNVARAAAGLFAHLESMGAKPHVVSLPADGKRKVGLDDFLKTQGTPDGLFSLAKAEPPTFHSNDAARSGAQYGADENGIFKIIMTDEGPVHHPITNFSAQIVAETVYTRQQETHRELEILATVGGKSLTVEVPAEEFERMSWVIPRLGAEAIIYPGYGAKDEARAAIQTLSPNIRQLIGIEKLGWQEGNGQHFFAHAGGVIGKDLSAGTDSCLQNRPTAKDKQGKGLRLNQDEGTISRVEVNTLGIRMRIPKALSRYRFEEPSIGNQLKQDIRDSMKLLTLAPLRISVPVYCAIWYAGSGDADFSIHLYGSTGCFKTEYAALATQHFGAGLDARNLPANWSSTSNYIRALSAYAGNVVLPVDDFVPTGSQYDIEKSNRAAEDVFRSQGNSAGRGRCYRDGTPQETEQPKCMMFSTGEVRPSGHSLTSRVLTLEINPGDIADRDDEAKMRKLTEAQRTAKSGAYSRATAAYIQYFASDFENNQKELKEQSERFRDMFASSCGHARTSDAAGKLLAGLDLFLSFAVEVGAIDDEKFEKVWKMAHDGLYEVLQLQDQEQSDESPVSRFLELLQTALSTGRAHLSYMLPPEDEGNSFGSPTYFGHLETTISVDKEASELPDASAKPASKEVDDETSEASKTEYKKHFIPQGQRIGWKKLDDLYFEPKESLAMAQRLAKDMNQPPIPLTHKALGKRLAESGLLCSSRKDRNVSRVSIEGQKQDVFHIKLDDFIEIERCEGDFVDDRNELAFQEKEEAEKRLEQQARLRKARRDKANSWSQEQLKKLIPD